MAQQPKCKSVSCWLERGIFYHRRRLCNWGRLKWLMNALHFKITHNFMSLHVGNSSPLIMQRLWVETDNVFLSSGDRGVAKCIGLSLQFEKRLLQLRESFFMANIGFAATATQGFSAVTSIYWLHHIFQGKIDWCSIPYSLWVSPKMEADCAIAGCCAYRFACFYGSGGIST